MSQSKSWLNREMNWMFFHCLPSHPHLKKIPLGCDRTGDYLKVHFKHKKIIVKMYTTHLLLISAWNSIQWEFIFMPDKISEHHFQIITAIPWGANPAPWYFLSKHTYYTAWSDLRFQNTEHQLPMWWPCLKKITSEQTVKCNTCYQR